MSDYYLLLKWGSLKSWKMPKDGVCFDLLKKWYDGGFSCSAKLQKDTDEQKKILCELIDNFDGDIINDWDGKTYNKDQAKKYIMEYDK